MKPKSVIFLIIVVLSISGCADVQHVDECLTGHVYGFFGGFWHGLIAPLAFIGSICSDNIAVFAVNNNGGWYVFGFLLGITCWFRIMDNL